MGQMEREWCGRINACAVTVRRDSPQLSCLNSICPNRLLRRKQIFLTTCQFCVCVSQIVFSAVTNRLWCLLHSASFGSFWLLLQQENFEVIDRMLKEGLKRPAKLWLLSCSLGQ